MWPILLDMTKEESMQHLRCLEIDAFSGLVSALRAQGGLDNEKLKILKDTGTILHISQDRHKAEIRRVVNDEKLNTIAYHVNGEKHSGDEWVEEGQRLIPLMARIAPQTAYSAIADEVADTASKINKQLPAPASTERKRPPPISPTHSNASTSDQCNKSLQFRMAEPELKKRKLNLSLENSNIVQHFMGPPKISKIQQIYRQKTKARQKEQQQLLKAKQLDVEKPDYLHMQQITMTKTHQSIATPPPQKVQTKLSLPQTCSTPISQNSPKINILQNISIHAPVGSLNEEQKDFVNSDVEMKECLPQPGCSIDQAKIISKFIHNNPLNKVNHLTIKAGTSDIKKTFKVCAPRKLIPPKTVTTSSGQKLIVVSNPQTLTTSSILQRTLSTIPFKNISVKNFDKFKIVSSTNNSQQPLTTPIQIQNNKKVVTMRTTANKKLMPYSQVQVLNTKGGIKVLPLGGKIISKTPITLSTEETKIITSTPLIMSSKPQENSQISIITETNASQESTNVPLDSPNTITEEEKSSSVLDSVEKIETPEVIYSTDIDLEEEPVEETAEEATEEAIEEAVEEEVLEVINDFKKEEEVIEVPSEQIEECQENDFIAQPDSEIHEIETVKIEQEQDGDSYYILDGEHTSEDIIIDGIQQPLEVLNIVGSLDPITGQYSINDDQISVVESHVIETDASEDLNAMN